MSNEIIDEEFTEDTGITGGREDKEEEYVPIALIDEKRKNFFGLAISILTVLNYLFFEKLEDWFVYALDFYFTPSTFAWFIIIVPLFCLIIASIINVIPYSKFTYQRQFMNTFMITWIVFLGLHAILLIFATNS